MPLKGMFTGIDVTAYLKMIDFAQKHILSVYRSATSIGFDASLPTRNGD